MTTSRFALDTQLVAPLADSAAAARRAAEIGLDGLFSFEGPHDVFLPLALAAGAAPVDLYTNAAIAFPRSPMHLAHTAYDLQLLTEGRFLLGLGSQIRPQIEKRYGATWGRPVERMREIVLAVKAIFAAWHHRERLEFRGEFTTHTIMAPNFDPGPNPYGLPPVLVGALGPRMTTMAAESADGLLVMPFSSTGFVHDHTLPLVTAGLAGSGRGRDDFTLVGEVIVCCGRTDEELATADAGTRNLLAFYGSTPAYRRVLDHEGYGDLQPELNGLSKQGRWAEMPALVDDTLLGTIAARGTPAECADAIVARYGGHADRVAFYLPYRHDDDLVADLVAALRAAQAAG